MPIHGTIHGDRRSVRASVKDAAEIQQLPQPADGLANGRSISSRFAPSRRRRLDYLVTPVGESRFAATMKRLRKRLQSSSGPTRDETIVVTTSRGATVLHLSEIDWIESADNYVSLHAGRETHLIRETLTSLETKLNPQEFLRIRHAAIVNVKRIRELRPLFKGEYEIVLQNGTRLTSSRRYRQHLEELLGS